MNSSKTKIIIEASFLNKLKDIKKLAKTYKINLMNSKKTC